VVRGVEKNATLNVTWQGWYSQTYIGACPASTVVYDGVIPAANGANDGRASGSFTFGWLITTSDGTTKEADTAASMKITNANSSAVEAVVTVNGAAQTLYLPLDQPASAVRSYPVASGPNGNF
jgi:hypothetical protein